MYSKVAGVASGRVRALGLLRRVRGQEKAPVCCRGPVGLGGELVTAG